jgi:hypothetical protein
MGLNFPNSPSQGQVFTSTTGLQYVYLDGVWRIVEAPQDIGKAEARNRIVNGAMQISQENGNTGGSISTHYPADQWRGDNTSAATATTQRVQVVTPNGSLNRFRATLTAADTSLAATDYWLLWQNIEGIRIADFRWGSAQARQVVLRFGFKAPAGTYSVALRNSALDRSYVANFTISAGQANTDTEQTLIIPGDATGTWLTDTGIGVSLFIVAAAGSNFIGVAGWQAGNVRATSANTNNVAVNGSVFELYDVGLYLDPLNTGIAPPWQMPDEAEELRACMRYFYKINGIRVYVSSLPLIYFFKTSMRILPAVTGGGAGFALDSGGTEFVAASQTTNAFQNLVFSARM